MNKVYIRRTLFILVSSVVGYGFMNHMSQAPTRPVPLEQQLSAEFARAEKNEDVPGVLLLLKIIVDDALKKGVQAPDYNICELQVAHSPHLFCEQNKGIARVNMPQLKGKPAAGSPADALPRDVRGEVDGSQAFREYLRNKGYTISVEDVPAMALKATQNEIVGSKVAGIWYAMQDPTTKVYQTITAMPLFISQDNYILDGHHRWAAAVAHGISSGNLAGVRMKAERVNVGIDQLVQDANEFTRQFGIRAEAGLAGLE